MGELPWRSEQHRAILIRIVGWAQKHRKRVQSLNKEDIIEAVKARHQT